MCEAGRILSVFHPSGNRWGWGNRKGSRHSCGFVAAVISGKSEGVCATHARGDYRGFGNGAILWIGASDWVEWRERRYLNAICAAGILGRVIGQPRHIWILNKTLAGHSVCGASPSKGLRCVVRNSCSGKLLGQALAYVQTGR